MVKHRGEAAGFTLIEIVIVLAIAGLIMAIVFFAVGGAQASRRDTVRKTDLRRLATQVETFASNNYAQYPADLSNPADWGAAGSYTPANFNDPTSGASYFSVGYTTGTTPGATPGSLAYQRGGTGCDGVTALTNNQFSLHIRLERGIDCVDTH